MTVSVEEAADQATTVTLHHPEGGTATAGSDYRLAGSVEIPAGGTTVTATLTVQDDEIYEGEETVGIRAGAAGVPGQSGGDGHDRGTTSCRP